MESVASRADRADWRDAETLGVTEAAGYADVRTALLDETGTVAVVGEPFAGREAVLDRAVDRTDADRVTLDPDAVPPSVPDTGALVVDDCQHLFTREVGGFDRLDAFLDAVARTDALVVTSWTRDAWDYLTLARDADRPFDVTFRMPALDAAHLERVAERAAVSLPEFVADPDRPSGPVEWHERSVSVAGLSVTLPYPTLDREWVTARRTRDLPPRTAAFQRLASVSGGNPGVALAVLRRSVRDGRLAPAYVQPPVEAPSLSTVEAFALRLVLASERLPRVTMRALVPDGEAVLRVLARQDLVDVGEVVTPRPEAVPVASKVLERRRVP